MTERTGWIACEAPSEVMLDRARPELLARTLDADFYGHVRHEMPDGGHSPAAQISGMLSERLLVADASERCSGER